MDGRESKQGLAGLWATGAVLALVLFAFPLSLDFPLIDPGEGFHASVAREMVEGGDWLTPRFLSEPFLDKAVLYFWTQALSLEAFGMTPWTLEETRQSVGRSMRDAFPGLFGEEWEDRSRGI